MTLLINQGEIENLLTMDTAIEVIEDLFKMAGRKQVENPARMCFPIGEGFMRFGPAVLHDWNVAGFKLWANFGSGPARGWNYLFDLGTGELLAILHSYSLGRFRTSAATAVAAKYLARPDASSVAIFGTGRLAEAQLQAIMAVRPIRSVRAYSRTRASREAFCAKVTETLKIPAIASESAEENVKDADIVLTITNSSTPVLFAKHLQRPCLVLGVGANQWYEREIDHNIVKQAALVVVDGKDQARVESGDLLYAIAHGGLTWDRVEELGDIVSGRVPVPDPAKNTIIFESHGLATEDVAVSLKAYQLAKARNLGRPVDLNLGKARSEIASPGVDKPRMR